MKGKIWRQKKAVMKEKFLFKERMEAAEEYIEFLKEFKEESDRAAAILGVAKLDLLLYQILVKVLLPNAGNKDDLFDGEGPLSTFSAKIHLCYRMGLFDSAFARSLHLIRKIRNDFAHEVTGCKFDSGSHRNRINELVAPLRKVPRFKEGIKIIFEDKTSPSVYFRMALAWLAMGLGVILNKTEVLILEPLPLIVPGHFIPKHKESPKEDIKS